MINNLKNYYDYEKATIYNSSNRDAADGFCH